MGSLDDFMGKMPNLKTLPTGLKPGDHHQNVHHSLHVLWMPLLHSIPLRSHSGPSAWAGLGACHTSLAARANPEKQCWALELCRADLSQSDCSSEVLGSCSGFPLLLLLSDSRSVCIKPFVQRLLELHRPLNPPATSHSRQVKSRVTGKGEHCTHL